MAVFTASLAAMALAGRSPWSVITPPVIFSLSRNNVYSRFIRPVATLATSLNTVDAGTFNLDDGCAFFFVSSRLFSLQIHRWRFSKPQFGCILFCRHQERQEYTRLLPCSPQNSSPRIEHLIVSEDGTAVDYISKALNIPPL